MTLENTIYIFILLVIMSIMIVSELGLWSDKFIDMSTYKRLGAVLLYFFISMSVIGIICGLVVLFKHLLW